MSIETRNRIQTIFRDVFDDERLEISDNTSPASFSAWDSLGHIRLISALEDDLSLSFTLEEIEEMDSVRKILAVVTAKL